MSPMTQPPSMTDGLHGRIVVKVGTSSITNEAGRIAPERMHGIAEGLAAIEAATGVTPVLVSSGAGAAGRERLGLTLPLTLPDKQAAAAVGQTRLMAEWEHALEPRPVAQLLLSAGDMHDRERYVNAKNALLASLRVGAVPIVNENDSVATAELKLGDNDTLSAWVAYLVDASLLVILTDVEGLYDADPHAQTGARLLDRIEDLDAATRHVGASHGRHGTGGMVTKLHAARIARDAGIPTRIAGVGGAALLALARGETPGTYVPAGREGIRARKAWLAQQPAVGRLVIDEGAAAALRDGRSLLPKGIREVQGVFAFGDPVDVVLEDGTVIARGLGNFAADALTRIAGLHTRDIAEVLGAKDFDEAVHRDNLVLLPRGP